LTVLYLAKILVFARLGPYKQTYASYGDFGYFTLLFVTLGAERVENVRREMHDLPAELAQYFRFSTYELAMGDFLGSIWKSRSIADHAVYPLVRDVSADTG
jgi:hypothetical protein